VSGADQALRDLAQRIRIDSLQMTHQSRASHIGSCFSIAELLAVLYGAVLRYRAAEPEWPQRDRLIVSKGHAAAAVYAVLAAVGYFPHERLAAFYRNGGGLPGHVTRGIAGVEVSTGSLGHGLPIALGMALADQRDGTPQRVFCLISDGECDEGTTWEAALFAAQHRLANLTVLLDSNRIQSLGRVSEVLDLEPLADKWRSFGWAVREVDGHDVTALRETLQQLPFHADQPNIVIARTIKGRGVSFMEDRLLWHYRSAQGDEYAAALAELQAGTTAAEAP
jgi:transketolase